MNDMELNSIMTRVGVNSKIILQETLDRLIYTKEEMCLV